MKHRGLTHLIGSVFLLTGLAGIACGQTIHLAPDGDDAALGSAETPLASLERALTLLRGHRTADPTTGGEPVPITVPTIVLHDGDYFLSAPVRLTGLDSGRAEASLTITSAPGERARLIGGVRLDPAAFVPVEDPQMRSRLIDESVRPFVRCCDLRRAGITRFDAIPPRGMRHAVHPAPMELFIDGGAMTVARWPNEGFVHTGEAIDSGSIPRDGETDDRAPVFRFENERLARWQQATDAFAYGYWKWDWADEAIRVADVDAEASTITLARPHTYGVFASRPFYVENLLEEIDAPGEYYIDRAAGILYLLPPHDLEDSEILLSTMAEPLLDLKGASHVCIRALDLLATRGDAIRIEGGEDVEVAGCRLHNLGNRAVIVSGGQGHTVRSCDIYETGEGGIVLSGGDRRTLTPAGHAAVNNDIHHFNRRTSTYRPGVSLSGVGNVVAHNHIHDAPHSAIIFGGNDHRIEFNEIDHVLLRTGDGGAVYTGRDWTTRGHVIRNNYFHDLAGERKWENAVYIDDMACGTTIVANIFHRCHWGMLLGGGRDLIVEGNLFIDCTLAVHLDARGLGWASRMDGTMRQRLEAMPYQEEPWRSRYPELVGILDDEPMTPKHNLLRGNLLVRSGKIDADLAAAARKHGVIEGNLSVVDDPDFFTLIDGLLAFSDEVVDLPGLLGFQPPPLAEMGLTQDAYRAQDGELILHPRLSQD
jgi:Right handed beta helix region